MVKAFLLFIVYGVLAINFVFLAPKTVPEFKALQKFEIKKDDMYCVESGKKNPAYTKIMGKIGDKELKTYDLGTDRCLQIFGITSTFIQYKEQPVKYTIYVEDDKGRIFGDGWLLYQIEANGEILLPYEETSKAYLHGRKKFFYIALGVLLLMAVPMLGSLYKKIKKQGP